LQISSTTRPKVERLDDHAASYQGRWGGLARGEAISSTIEQLWRYPDTGDPHVRPLARAHVRSRFLALDDAGYCKITV
jgi:hypothetical protein